MQFPERYFEDEVREGFFVPSMIKRAWAAELDVLAQIDRICTKYNIQYFAEWGTLLGAVRHNGFIPWDDDLDIGMKRADYERFLQVAGNELPEGYKINNLRTRSDFHLFLARVMNTGHMCYEDEHLKKFHEFPYIAGVDIFLMDYVSRDEQEEKIRDTLADYGIVLADYIAEKKIGINEAKEGLRKLNQSGFPRFEYDISCIGRWLCDDENDDAVKEYIETLHQTMYIQAERLFTKFSDEESDELTQLFPFGLRRREHRYPKEFYSDCIRLPFENTTIPVPIGYDAMLKRRYGDYIVVRKDCGGHGYPFYESQQEQMDALLDIKLPRYSYTESEKKYSQGVYDCEEGAESFAELASAVCNELENCSDPYTAQELAVDFGTMIEKLYGENQPVIKDIENYCELQYECVQSGGNHDGVAECVGRIRKGVQDDILEVGEAVFIVTKISEWKYIQRIYEDMKQRGVRIYVIPVPYYHKRYDGSLYDENWEYEAFLELLKGENVYPARYNEYNIVLHHPDYVYIQNPYDEWNAGISIHPLYYTGKIVRNCRSMIYVPPFTLDEFTREQCRDFHNMTEYVVVPGVVRAKRVLVQSENMRETYIDKLTEWAGEGSRGTWERKILGTGTQLKDKGRFETTQENSIKNMPALWKKVIFNAEGIRKKIVLYHNEAAFFLENREAAIEKVKRAFEVFSACRDDISMIWNVGGETKKAVERIAPEIFNDLEQLEEEAKRIGIYDTSDGRMATEVADAYYGDGSYLSRLCQKDGKPVMVENVEI